MVNERDIYGKKYRAQLRDARMRREEDDLEYLEKMDHRKMRFLFGSIWDLTGLIIDPVIEIFNDEVTWNRWRRFYRESFMS